MAGIRLHHPFMRSAEGSTATVVVELPMPYPVAYDCNRCGKTHQRKAIHLQVDGQGDVIVSQDVYEKLQTAMLGGFSVTNEVPNPPALRVGAVDQDKAQIIEVPLNPDLAASPFYTPATTKYEGQARMWRPMVPVWNKILEVADRKATKERAEHRSIHILKGKGT